MRQYREIPMEPTLSRRLGVPRPDPLKLASKRAEIAYLEAQIAHLHEQERNAREHLAVLAEQQTEQVEAMRADRARLAALEAMARAGGGHVPDAGMEEERRKLRVRLEERPASLAAALEADLERIGREVTELTDTVAFNKRGLAKQEELTRQFDEEALEVAIDRVRKGVASAAEEQLVIKAGRWPEKEG